MATYQQSTHHRISSLAFRQLSRLALGAALIAGGSAQLQAQNAALAPPIVNWSYQRHASTPIEGFLRGHADVVQSAGQAHYLSSLAAINYQEAVRRDIENRGLFVRTYFENKELNRQFREKYAAAPPSREQWARVSALANPARLSAEHYDSSGRMVWPHILRGDEYRAFRDRIDDLMSSRTPEMSGDGSPVQREIAILVNGMAALLKSNIDTVTSSQYGEAKGFLLSVGYEAQQPLDDSPAGQSTDPVPAADDVDRGTEVRGGEAGGNATLVNADVQAFLNR
jgi:hypothetical protein